MNNAEACWAIIVQHAGADSDPQTKTEFLRYAQENPDFLEYRFCGVLGFGGKLWHYLERDYVTCYPEDETPERVEVLKKVNALLAEVPSLGVDKPSCA